ncbi:MAG: UbiA family prenyltransferase [Candidatus Marinimicrobia bacterium]|nr:UbiA family prenyltransferase [Candidatus Neomarinimicrobiota bacterium]
MIAKFKSFVELSRPLNLLQAALAILVGYWLVGGGSILELRFAMLTVLAFTAGGNAINDYFDYETDLINKPRRVIPSGRISKKGALCFAIIMFSLGLLALIPIFNLYSGIIAIMSLLLLIIYTPILKNIVILGNLTVSIILGAAFIFTTAVFGQIRTGVVPALLAFGFNFVREIIKDMEDVAGDRKQSINTLSTKYGKQTARYFAILGIMFIFIGIPIPYVLDIYSHYYLWTVLIFVEIPLLYSFINLLQDISKKNCAKLSAILKYDVFFGLLAVFLGRF